MKVHSVQLSKLLGDLCDREHRATEVREGTCLHPTIYFRLRMTTWIDLADILGSFVHIPTTREGLRVLDPSISTKQS